MVTTPDQKIEPTTFVSHVGMVVAIDRVEGALNYVNLALKELDDANRDGRDIKLTRQYLINTRFLLIGQKVT